MQSTAVQSTSVQSPSVQATSTNMTPYQLLFGEALYNPDFNPSLIAFCSGFLKMCPEFFDKFPLIADVDYYCPLALLNAFFSSEFVLEYPDQFLSYVAINTLKKIVMWKPVNGVYYLEMRNEIPVPVNHETGLCVKKYNTLRLTGPRSY